MTDEEVVICLKSLTFVVSITTVDPYLTHDFEL